MNTNNSLIALYSFDDSNNLGKDFTINKQDLTVYPGVTYDPTDKKLGIGSLVFNGSGYLEYINNGTFTPDSFTISFWAKIYYNGAIQTIASCRNPFGSNYSGWVINLNETGQLSLNLGNNSGISYPSFATGTITWQHIALTVARIPATTTATATLYTNGTSYTSSILNYFNFNPLSIIYDFTPYNTLASWTAYATSIGATTNIPYYDVASDAVWNPGIA
jgi:hypothetical protein